MASVEPLGTDPDLVERARRGDAAAWRELYVALSGRLLLWLRSRPSGDSAADPEDLVMETWLVAAQRIADFSGSTDDFAGWLFGIARHQAINARRRTTRRATSPLDQSEESLVWGVVDHDEVAADDWVRHTLRSLPPREGEVLACMEVVGLDTAATAQALGISTTAVRVARHRGLTKLRKVLSDPVPSEKPPAPSPLPHRV